MDHAAAPHTRRLRRAVSSTGRRRLATSNAITPLDREDDSHGHWLVPLVVSLCCLRECVAVSLSLDHRPIFHAYDTLPLAFADQLLTPILSKFLFNFQHDSTQLEKNKPGLHATRA